MIYGAGKSYSAAFVMLYGLVYILCVLILWWGLPRGHFMYAPSQWEMTLHFIVVSHWLGAYTNDPC